MAKQKDTGVYREFQSQVEEIVKKSKLKQFSEELAIEEKAKLAKLNIQAKLAANGQMLNAETGASMQKVIDDLENNINKIAGKIQSEFNKLAKEADSIGAGMQLGLGNFEASNLVRANAEKHTNTPRYAIEDWKKNSTEDRRLHELTKNSINPYEKENPNYENLNDGIINDIAEMKILYGEKYTGNNKREYLEQSVNFIAALNKLKTTQDALSEGLLNGMNPEAIKEIEEAQKKVGLALAKKEKAHDEQTALKEVYQNDPRSDIAKKADPKLDFTEKTTAWNNAQIEHTEAINELEATIKRLPIVQKEAEAEIVQIKQDSAEKQSKIIDINSKEQLETFQEVADNSAKYELAKAEDTAEKVKAVKKKSAKDSAETEPETKSAFDSYKVFQGAGLIQSEIDLQKKAIADKMATEKEYTGWWESELKKRDTKELQEERDSAADRKRIEADYNAWWQNAIRDSEQKARETANNEKFLKQQSDRKAEQLARDQKAEAASIERKEQMDKQYLEQKEDRERQHQEKLTAIEKSSHADRVASTAKGALVAGAGMLGVYGVGDSIQRGMGMGVQFGSDIQLAQSIGNLSDKDKAEIQKNAMFVGKMTNATASEIALLDVELVKLGKSKDAIIEATKPVTEFAKTFEQEMAETGESSAMWSGVFEISMNRMIDIMGATFRNTRIKDISMFNEALASGAGMSKALNYTAEQTIALLATAIDNGQKADEASRGLQKLLQSARNADSEFAKYFGGTAKTFDEVIGRINAMSAAEKEVALTKMKSSNLTEENAKNLLAILMNSGKEINELNQKLINSDGLVSAAYAKSMESMKNEWDLVTSAVQGNALEVYQDLEPTLLRVTKALQGYLEAASDPDSSTAKMIELVEALTAAVAALALVSGTLVGVPLLIGRISTAIKALYGLMIANPITATIAGVAALVAAFYTWKDSAEEVLEKEAQRLEIQKQNNKETTEAAEKNKALTEEYQKLAGKENLSNTEKDRMNTILGDLKKIYPDIITETNNHALALDQVKLAAEKANKELESLAGVERIRKRAEAENTVATQQLKVDESVDNIKDRSYDSFRSSQASFLTGKSNELLLRKDIATDGSILAIEKTIGELESKRLELKASGQSEGAGYEAMKKMIADAITYRDELKKLVEAKKELAILNSDPVKSKDTDKPKDGSEGGEGTVNLDAKQQLELKLMRLKTIADVAKFESDQDAVNFEKKIEYARANYEYQKALATQPVVNFSENNAAQRGELIKAEKAKLHQLEETYKDDLAKIALSVDLKPVTTRKLEAQLGGLEDKPNSLKHQIDLENAVYDEKVKQLGLQKDSGALSKQDYDLQVRIAEIMRIQNIELAKRNNATKGLALEQTEIEIKKLNADSLNYALEAESIIKRAEAAIAGLDKSDTEKYDLDKEKIEVQRDTDLTGLDQKQQQSISQSEIIRLKVRQQESGKDYGIDRAILDEEYSAEKSDIENNKSLDPELKAAKLLQAASNYKKKQEKLLSDHVNYYAEMTQTVFSTISKITDYFTKKEMDAAKKKYDHETKLADKAYKDKVKANEGANRTLAKLAEQEEKDKESREKAWEARQDAINAKKKKWAIAETILNMTVAIAKAFAQEGVFGWAESIALGAQLTAMTVTLATQQFSKGKVMIDTPDDPNDRILAWFNPGESVINEKSSRANPGLLNAINDANGKLEIPSPTSNHLFIPGAVAANSELLAEMRLMREYMAQNIAKTGEVTKAIDSKSWNVDIRNESKGYDPRQVSNIVQDGNKKNAKLTVWG